MKICINCGKPGFIQTDPYGGKIIFCTYCGSTSSKEISSIDINPILKHVSAYCKDCGEILGENYHNWTVCPKCYGTIVRN